MSEQLDYPFQDVVNTANEILASVPTAQLYQKFTCAHCGARQTMETPNTFHTTGICEECDSVTDIEARGCNYMASIGISNQAGQP
jgi:transcription elongation factor Elf1